MRHQARNAYNTHYLPRCLGSSPCGKRQIRACKPCISLVCMPALRCVVILCRPSARCGFNSRERAQWIYKIASERRDDGKAGHSGVYPGVVVGEPFLGRSRRSSATAVFTESL
ncbi:hypothetical protein BU23DRAFT_295877 [Bimuria novae-zelandiae CBS 107.79]|uniref:Uncharacterized protein n=1 Tax=Bimuria novae-zelandiae CBS 107.79 TaxID=1447943 RepID=A0A6A5VKE9_9PLEO|nr:hypothetical protein BU23DRAFT_295877 [Bimuria novae-zelandiae CBS 107.79]